MMKKKPSSSSPFVTNTINKHNHYYHSHNDHNNSLNSNSKSAKGLKIKHVKSNFEELEDYLDQHFQPPSGANNRPLRLGRSRQSLHSIATTNTYTNNVHYEHYDYKRGGGDNLRTYDYDNLLLLLSPAVSQQIEDNSSVRRSTLGFENKEYLLKLKNYLEQHKSTLQAEMMQLEASFELNTTDIGRLVDSYHHLKTTESIINLPTKAEEEIELQRTKSIQALASLRETYSTTASSNPRQKLDTFSSENHHHSSRDSDSVRRTSPVILSVKKKQVADSGQKVESPVGEKNMNSVGIFPRTPPDILDETIFD